MRINLVSLALLVGILQLQAYDLKAQKLTLNVSQLPLENVLKEISRQTAYDFLYNAQQLKNNAVPVSINGSNIPLDEMLVRIFEKQPRLGYVIDQKTVVIKPKKEAAQPTEPAIVQQRTVSGRVTDETGTPLTGVSILVKGSGRGTSTSEAGAYSIDVGESDQTLVFSYIGYAEQEVPIAGKSEANVVLQAQSSDLEEVVVVGYGTMLKQNLSTAVSTIDASKLTERPTTSNVLQGMAGKIPGVSISLNSGAPGGSPAIKIRGTGSLNSDNEPLYVVDGVVGVNPDVVDPNVIKSIDVLKDATSSAIYGSRGANGVVVITTKEGRKNGTTISYNTAVSAATLAREVDVLDAYESLEVFKRAYEYAPGRIAPHLDPNNDFARKDDLFNPDGTPKYNTNWQKVTTRTAMPHQHSLTFSGGTDKLTVAANVSYRDNQGIMRNTYEKQLNGFVNLNWDVKEWFHLQAVVNLGSNNGRNSENSISRYMLEYLPFLPVRYPDGTYSRKGDYPGAEDAENPVKILDQRESYEKKQYNLTNLIGTFKISPKLKLTTSFSKQEGADMTSFYAPSTLWGYGSTQNGRAERGHAVYSSWTNEDYLTYDDQWGNHNLNVVGGVSWYYDQSTFSNVGTENFFDDFFKYYNLGVGTVRSVAGSGYDDSKMNSYYARANYNYDNRYILGASFRYDGSSRFGANNKYGFFPSFSAAWLLSNEEFFSSIKSNVENLKLRMSYGIVGNAGIGNYSTMARYGNSLLPFNKDLHTVVTLQEMSNPDLKWERANQFDAGLDVSMFNGRIEFVADFYNKITSDLLYRLQLPSTTGYESSMTNLGKIRNRGLELGLTTRNIQTPDFLWTTSVNYSMNRSMVIDIDGNIIGKWGGRIVEGRPLNQFYGYVRLGTWGADEAAEAAKYNKKPGDLKYLDRNGNGQKDGDDQDFLGSGTPKFEMNLANNISYKGFTFLFDLHALYGNQVINFTRQLMENRVTFSNSYGGILENAWTPDHQNAMVASLRLPGDGYENDVDSHSAEPGSFLRVRNVGLRYDFENNILNRWRIQTLSLGLNVENALLFTKYSGGDPEVTSYDPVFEQGVDFYTYPKPRTYSFTLGVSF